MNFNKVQRQLVLWIVGLVLLQFLMSYFGNIAIIGLVVLLGLSIFDAKKADRLEELRKAVSDKVEDFQDNFREL